MIVFSFNVLLNEFTLVRQFLGGGSFCVCLVRLWFLVVLSNAGLDAVVEVFCRCD